MRIMAIRGRILPTSNDNTISVYKGVQTRQATAARRKAEQREERSPLASDTPKYRYRTGQSRMRASTKVDEGGKSKIFTVPTVLTIARIFAIPFVAYAYSYTGPVALGVCTFLYIAACFTDWLDGYLARKTGAISQFGAFLDPVGDKLMVATILILLTFSPPAGGLSAKMPAIIPFSSSVIICREIAMSAVREWAASAGPQVRSAVAVNSLGKWKTAIQMIALGMLIACRDGSYGSFALEVFEYAGPIFLLVSAMMALYSFIVYFKGIMQFMIQS